VRERHLDKTANDHKDGGGRFGCGQAHPHSPPLSDQLGERQSSSGVKLPAKENDYASLKKGQGGGEREKEANVIGVSLSGTPAAGFVLTRLKGKASGRGNKAHYCTGQAVNI